MARDIDHDPVKSNYNKKTCEAFKNLPGPGPLATRWSIADVIRD